MPIRVARLSIRLSQNKISFFEYAPTLSNAQMNRGAFAYALRKRIQRDLYAVYSHYAETASRHVMAQTTGRALEYARCNA